MYCPCTANRMGSIPILCTFETLRPIGNVTMLPLFLAYQFTSMFGDVPTLHPSRRKYEAEH